MLRTKYVSSLTLRGRAALLVSGKNNKIGASNIALGEAILF